MENLLRLWNVDKKYADDREEALKNKLDKLGWYDGLAHLEVVERALVDLKANNTFSSDIKWTGNKSKYSEWLFDVLGFLKKEEVATPGTKGYLYYEGLYNAEIQQMISDDNNNSENPDPEEDDDYIEGLPF